MRRLLLATLPDYNDSHILQVNDERFSPIQDSPLDGVGADCAPAGRHSDDKRDE